MEGQEEKKIVEVKQKSRNFGHLLEKFEQSQMDALHKDKRIDVFKSGDRIKVTLAVYDGTGKQYIRDQIIEGICVGRKRRGLCSSFILRKIYSGTGVEWVLPLYSNTVKSVVRTGVGQCRRAKAYFIRGLTEGQTRKALKIRDVTVKKK